MLSFKGIPLKKFIPATIWFFVVLVIICLPKEDIPEVDGWWGWLNKIYFDKWIHAGIFAVMAFLFMYPFIRAALATRIKNQIILVIAILICLWGFTTELIQLYIPGRSFDMLDWAADSFGALLALLLCRRLLPKRSLNESL
jgi:hypothetical protein